MRTRVLRGLSTVLIVAGVAVLVDVAATLLWQEPITALIALRHQHQLSDQLETLEAGGPTALELAELRGLPRVRDQIAVLARSVRHRVPRGAAVGRLHIPRLGKSLVVVNGSDSASLRGGPGIYDATPFPGATQTTAIAGHRTTYLAPFRHIDQLRHGDTIELRMPYADFHYTVQYTRTVLPTATWILRGRGYERLVLSACAPLFSASHRIIVFARLTSTVPNRSFVRHHAVAVKPGTAGGR
jgi:sortase A